MGVVEHLDVEGSRAALEQQVEKLRRVGLHRRILLAFAGRADQGGVGRVDRHVDVVGIGAVVEQVPGDGDRVRLGGRMGETREAEGEERGGAERPARLVDQLRLFGQPAPHLFQFAADDRGEEIGPRQLRLVRQHPLRPAVERVVVALAVHVAVPAGGAQEFGGPLRPLAVAGAAGGVGAFGQHGAGVFVAQQGGPFERC